MDEINAEFEEYVQQLRIAKGAGAATGTDGEIALDNMEDLVTEYRTKIRAAESPSEGRELLARFREEAGRL